VQAAPPREIAADGLAVGRFSGAAHSAPPGTRLGGALCRLRGNVNRGDGNAPPCRARGQPRGREIQCRRGPSPVSNRSVSGRSSFPGLRMSISYETRGSAPAGLNSTHSPPAASRPSRGISSGFQPCDSSLAPLESRLSEHRYCHAVMRHRRPASQIPASRCSARPGEAPMNTGRIIPDPHRGRSRRPAFATPSC
jgi:hypothetical protein